MDEAGRVRSLGFVPQKESEFNNHLPYATNLDEESNRMLGEIKENLGRAVQLRDIKIGARHWVGQLDRYLSLYYHRFSKDDHILFVKLLFELMTMPMQEFCLVEKIAKVLNNLLKKKNNLSREDIIFPWRPLYEVMKKVADEKSSWRVHSPRFENAMNNVIKSCSHYFHEDATQEMLDEWRPWLCPLDTMAVHGLQFLEVFLPTSLPPELHHKGFKLWLDEFLQLWYSFHSSPSWEGEIEIAHVGEEAEEQDDDNDEEEEDQEEEEYYEEYYDDGSQSLVSLFSRLAHRNVSYIDWTPHVQMIFTRLLRSFNLPVGNRQTVPIRNNNAYDINNMCMWIVGMMGGPNGMIQEHLVKLFKALHSFYHPSNVGKWTTRLGSFLQNLPKFFVQRLRRERFKDFKWLPPIPESHKLTDNQITEFVDCMKSSVFVAMFSKFGSQDASSALRSLSVLRPEIIIPPLLEKMYPAMETLIEPHRLIACMICIVAVARPMMSARQIYPDGRSHVLPLLQLALPGIDPNDFRKTLVTLQMVSTFVSLIPIVDVSDAYHTHPNLTEMERELCSATAQFEDFVLCLIDRVQNVVENSSQDSSFSNVERLNPEHTVLEMGLASTLSTTLQQCSTPIYMSALKKIHRFATNSVFEVKVSGKLASNICRACVRIKPDVALKMFVPQICSSIQSFMRDHPGAIEEENLDDSLLWNILLLSQVVSCDGSKLIAYREELLDVISLTLPLKCVQGYTLACSLAKTVLHSLTCTYPLEFCSFPFDLDQPTEGYLPIHDWGEFKDLEEMQWHTSSAEEMNMAKEIVDKFLLPEIEAFSQASAEKIFDKDDLLRRLMVVQTVFQGASFVFPTWEAQPYKLNESQVPVCRVNPCVSLERQEILCKGSNMRESIHDALSHLLDYMAKSQEDDTKSLMAIIKICECLVSDHGTVKAEFDARWKSYHIIKNALKNVLQKEKRHSRTLMVDRIQLQHELRNVNQCTRHFSTRHARIMTELLQLSVSRYREVRKKAQVTLHNMFRNFNFSYKTCISQLAENLWNKELPEHIFKGSLFAICGTNTSCLASRVNWETLHLLWPALTQSQQSEKPSVIKVIDDIVNKIFKSLETFSISIECSQSAIDAAGALLTSPSMPAVPSISVPTQQELQQGVNFEKQFNQITRKHYDDLVQELINLVDNGDLPWKFKRIGLELLSLLLHDDSKPSPQMVEVYAKHCIHDMLYIRKLSFSTLASIMELQKKPFVKIPVSVEKVCGVSPLDLQSLIPGDRPDNAWVKFDPNKMIETEEEWNSTVFVEKTHWGYYTWPKELRTYAPSNDQPDLNRPAHDLSPAELPLYNSMMKEEFVTKMVELLSLEEEKNTDKFRLSIYSFFKYMFRNYGDCFLESLKPHIERLMKDTGHDTHATRKRCAMEMLGGVISGSKMWSFQKTKRLWEWLCPLLQYGINNLSVETLSDWGTMFLQICGNRDPRKLQWMYSLLLNNPLNGEGGAFGDSGRLYILQHVVLQQEWRIPAYLHALIDYLRPQMAHYYKNVRDRMGALLSCLHQLDYLIHPSSVTESPQRAELLKFVLPQLEQFRDVILAHNNRSKTEASANNEESPMEGVEVADQGDEDKKEAVRLCKTVVRWVNISFAKSMSAIPVEIFQLLPILENLHSEANDEDLRKDCNAVMLDLAQVLLPPQIIPNVLETIKEVSGLKSWRARAGMLSYTQQLVFGNFFLMQETGLRQAVQSMLLYLMCDEQLEVREMAAVTLSGMIHCGYLDMDKDMRAHFERLRKTKVKIPKHLSIASRSNDPSSREPVSLQNLIQRHAGVLGLSAYIQAYPYDVPEFIPQVLVDLSVHVNDPQPIGTTVTKTLTNFRHTHHDNWHDHKRMFTDDQLVTLSDLLISPNYYA